MVRMNTIFPFLISLFAPLFLFFEREKAAKNKNYILSLTRGMLMQRGPPRPRESSEEGISWTVMP